jgi:hypothetical protein
MRRPVLHYISYNIVSPATASAKPYTLSTKPHPPEIPRTPAKKTKPNPAAKSSPDCGLNKFRQSLHELNDGHLGVVAAEQGRNK